MKNPIRNMQHATRNTLYVMHNKKLYKYEQSNANFILKTKSTRRLVYWKEIIFRAILNCQRHISFIQYWGNPMIDSIQCRILLINEFQTESNILYVYFKIITLMYSQRFWNCYFWKFVEKTKNSPPFEMMIGAALKISS